MALFGIFFFALISVSLSFDFEWDNDVVKKYSEMKMLNGCFGDNFLRSWRESLTEASKKCHGEQISAQIPHFIKYLKSNADLIHKFSDIKQKPAAPTGSNLFATTHVKSPSKYVFMVPEDTKTVKPSSQLSSNNQHLYTSLNLLLTPVRQRPLNAVTLTEYQTVNSPNLYQPNFLPPTYFQQQRPVSDFNIYQSPDRIWWKRSMDDSKSSRQTRTSKDMTLQSLDHIILSKVYPEIEILKQRLTSRVSNITCVLKQMEIINQEGRPNYGYNTELLYRLDLPVSLRDNLLEAQDFCKEFSMCVPVERMSNPLVAEIGNSFVFLKCMKKMIFHACMANDYIQADLSPQFRYNDLNSANNDSPQDTVRELERLLESENDIGFGF